jgi:hypothetical protein
LPVRTTPGACADTTATTTAGNAATSNRRTMVPSQGGLKTALYAKRSCAALSVFFISIVIVSGPTPRGTGVSAPAT